MDYAVQAEGVSKLYRIGAKRDLRSFREAFVDLFTPRSADNRAERMAERELWALRDVAFEVPQGTAIGFIGQNGAGKSTLLRILSRITEPTAGRVELRGRVSSLLEVGTGFHPELTGRENIQLNGAILGMTRHEIRARFDEIVAFAGVERFIDTQVKYYSSGMYMRLAFSVAAHLEPEILIVDEVLAVGDAAFQSKCLKKMDDVASHGRTVLFVSHNMPAVKNLCQSAVWLRNGRLVDIGESAAIVNRYLHHAISPAGREDIARIIQALPPDEAFRLAFVRLMQNRIETTNVTNGDPMEIEIGFDVLSTTPGLHVYLQLLDLDETVILESLHNGDDGASPVAEAGQHIATAIIPRNFLAPRPYHVRISAGIHKVRTCLPEPIQLTFDVQQSGFVNQAYRDYQTPGCIAPHLEWRIRRRDR